MSSIGVLSYNSKWKNINQSGDDNVVRFSSVQSLDRFGRGGGVEGGGGMRDDSAEIFLQSFPREALVSSSGMGDGQRGKVLLKR